MPSAVIHHQLTRFLCRLTFYKHTGVRRVRLFKIYEKIFVSKYICAYIRIYSQRFSYLAVYLTCTSINYIIFVYVHLLWSFNISIQKHMFAYMYGQNYSHNANKLTHSFLCIAYFETRNNVNNWNVCLFAETLRVLSEFLICNEVFILQIYIHGIYADCSIRQVVLNVTIQLLPISCYWLWRILRSYTILYMYIWLYMTITRGS